MNPPSAAAVVPLLSNREWKPAYETENGDLVELFYNPALACAKAYDRMTGYRLRTRSDRVRPFGPHADPLRRHQSIGGSGGSTTRESSGQRGESNNRDHR